MNQRRIRELCERLLNAGTEDEILRVAAELRDAIHEHIEEVRSGLLKVALSAQVEE